jgi:hypothetical protein
VLVDDLAVQAETVACTIVNVHHALVLGPAKCAKARIATHFDPQVFDPAHKRLLQKPHTEHCFCEMLQSEIPPHVQQVLRRKPPALWHTPEVEVRPSNLAGRGVFATAPCQAGDRLTLYPNHLVLWFPQGRANGDTLRVFHRHGYPDVGKIVDAYDAYRILVYPDVDLIGLPTDTDDRRFLGHMVNDRAGGGPVDAQTYATRAANDNNASFWVAPDGALWVVANRNIAAGCEITVTYGAAYWNKTINSVCN